MNWRSIWAIAKKDLKEVRQNKAAWGPGIIVPLIFAIVMPLIFIILAAGHSCGGCTARVGRS
jgi:hypothetical protein